MKAFSGRGINNWFFYFIFCQSHLGIEITQNLIEKGELKDKNEEIATASVIPTTATSFNSESDSGKKHRGIYKIIINNLFKRLVFNFIII